MASVNRQDYFDCGFQILATQGYGGLRLTSLCKQLRVTTGSFYNWFRNWDDFVDQFLEYWIAERTENVAVTASALRDPVERLVVLQQFATETPHAAEVAMRAWSSIDQRVRRVQEHVDQARLELIESALRDLGVPSPLAGRLAAYGLSLVIGHQHLHPDQMTWSLTHFITLAQLHAES
ncbi:TetR/AcrR family transcriptional regulator [Gordonia polyisoprenivorans]|uniref:TetR/AcrR family transcriptional regulator n=1 Tax=Gordonia polyisoprenivorans TaxID=84595 RepID=UPI001AD679BD|nr:TetR/AcrR family transcriptional regulator [Gordonia polyisoprenivorans]QTI68982.1 TetR/AcrR family transcriptional regulator [Gordonia polyisoprenivorans]